MRIYIGAVGRIRERNWLALMDEYSTRLSHYVKCDVTEFKDNQELLRQPPQGDVIVALEVAGARLTSTQFAQTLEAWSRRGRGRTAFIIGGADGIPTAISQSAHHRLSLSDMTLPHRLARLFLLEQLYRAFTILRGEPYARES